MALEYNTMFRRRSEMKLDKEQKKELRNLIVAYAKKLGYKARQNTIFRVKDAAMVYCDFLVVDSKKLIYRVNIKNYDYDDIFWKIMQMPSNSKEPDSLRAVGAFQAPTITVKTGQMELTDQYEEQAKVLVELVEESSNSFIEQYHIDEYAINCQGEMYINVLKYLAYVHMNKKSEARRIAEEALRDGDVNNFENEGKTFFEWALMQQ